MEICCFPSELSERQLTSTMTASWRSGRWQRTARGGPTSCGSERPQRDRLGVAVGPICGGGGGVPAPLSGFGRIRPVLGIFQGMKRARDNPKVLPAVRSAPVTPLPA